MQPSSWKREKRAARFLKGGKHYVWEGDFSSPRYWWNRLSSGQAKCFTTVLACFPMIQSKSSSNGFPTAARPSRSMNLPSKLTFASYLQYSPKGVGERGASSRDLRTAIKNDQPIYPAQADGSRVAINAIDRTVDLLVRAVQENPF